MGWHVLGVQQQLLTVTNVSWLCGWFRHAVQELETCKADPDNIIEGVLSHTTCGSKSWTKGSYLAITAVIVYSVYYSRLLGLSTAESVFLLIEFRVDSQASFVLDIE